MYKISKQLIEVDDFHGRCERTVKQELFAHFVLITMSRLYSDVSETLLYSLLNINADEKETLEQEIQVNFKNTLTSVSWHLEEILLPLLITFKPLLQILCIRFFDTTKKYSLVGIMKEDR